MFELSKRRKKEFANLMNEIDEFCELHHILQSKGSDAYFFSIGDTPYVVANRSRSVPEGTRFILASKTRIMQIYEDLCLGLQLDYRGYKDNHLQIKEQKTS